MGTELVHVSTEQVEAAILDGQALPEVESSEDAARGIMEQILTAPDVDSVLATFESAPIADYLGIPIEVHGVRWRPSAFTEGAPIFAVIDAVELANGERLTLTTSGRSVMAGLFRLEQLQAFPIALQVVEAKKATAAGYKPLQLKRAAKTMTAAPPVEVEQTA